MKEADWDGEKTEGEKSETDWGFKTESSGMATETKIGLLLMLVLMGAFGFVVYKKMDKHNQQVAKNIKQTGDEETESAEEEETSGKAVVQSQQQPVFDDPVSQEVWGHKHDHDHGHSHAQHGRSDYAQQQQGEFGDEPAFDDFKTEPEQQMAQGDGEDFNPLGDEQQTASQYQQPSDQVSDLFPADEPQGTAQAGYNQQQPQQQSLENQLESDFDPVNAAQNTQRRTYAEDHQHEPQDFAAFDQELNKHQNDSETFQQPTQKHAHPIEQADTYGSSVWEDDNHSAHQHGHVSSQSQVGRTDDEFGKGSQFQSEPHEHHHHQHGLAGEDALSDEHAQHMAQHAHEEFDLSHVDGEAPIVYSVQEGDTYWRISRKKYGTARYFSALARFNEQRIPDPKRMRPGMKVLIPHPQQLEALFPHMVSQQSQVTHAAGTGRETASASLQRAGFFRSEAGEPMYRIGKQDTLTGIAKEHLGRASRWVQVYQLNQDRIASPNNLKIGTELRLPADASQVELVQEPGDFR